MLVSSLKVGTILGLLAILGWQVIGLGDESPDQGTRSTPPADIGDSVPQLRVTKIAKDADTFSLAQLVGRSCHYLYFFDPSCPACRKAAKDWRTRPNKDSVNSSISISWVSISASRDSTAKFVRRFDLPDNPLIITDQPGLGNVGIGAIPGVWGTYNGRIATRYTGVSSTSPSALSADLSWCPEETS